MNVKLEGSVRLASSVVLIVFAPVLAAVYVNVPVVFPLVIETVLGVNVPPPLESLGVIVTVFTAQVNVTVSYLTPPTDDRTATLGYMLLEAPIVANRVR